VATERVIDLGLRRYADREYAGELPESQARAEAHQRERVARARARLCRRVKEAPGTGRMHLDRTDLLDLLLLLGVEDW
jgi:hypothetical protein